MTLPPVSKIPAEQAAPTPVASMTSSIPSFPRVL